MSKYILLKHNNTGFLVYIFKISDIHAQILN